MRKKNLKKSASQIRRDGGSDESLVQSVSRFFLWPKEAQRKKLSKKETPLWGISLSAESDHGLCPLDSHKLLKKLDQNLPAADATIMRKKNLKKSASQIRRDEGVDGSLAQSVIRFFLWPKEAQRKKLSKKETPLWGISLSAESDHGLCPLDSHKLLKKLDQNLPAAVATVTRKKHIKKSASQIRRDGGSDGFVPQRKSVEPLQASHRTTGTKKELPIQEVLEGVIGETSRKKFPLSRPPHPPHPPRPPRPPRPRGSICDGAFACEYRFRKRRGENTPRRSDW